MPSPVLPASCSIAGDRKNVCGFDISVEKPVANFVQNGELEYNESMLSGLFLILTGILIYLYPRIVVAVFSGFLIMAGMTLVLISWRLRRIYRAAGRPGNAWTRFIVRF